ncbi:TniB family NTP-binding protein [Virgibacillus sp. DJP39]|uniref:TniB family NTP-binding protein n=1 Tax=Virgibacillus sp. DJP39 TaxID=3409790 RepID=UPI003BB6228D
MNENSREIYEDMTKAQKLKQLKDFKIIHPEFKKALKMIKDCHESSKVAADPKSVLITGDSGAGKTTIYHYYADRFDQIIHGESLTTKRILHASIPSPGSTKFVVEQLLEQMGDFRFDSGTLNNKTHRLTRYIEENGVELIMLDEFQHFLKPSKKSVYDTADWFKSLINKTNVPVVLFGLKESETVLSTNEQLSRRFKRRIKLEHFGFNTKKEKSAFRALLREIDRNLPFKQDSNLDSEDFSERFYYASNGLMDTITSLIREASSFAIEENADSLELKHLAWAFSLDGHANRGKDNPFEYEDFTS